MFTQTTTDTDARAPPTLVHAAMTDAALDLGFVDLTISVEPTEEGTHVRLKYWTPVGFTHWYFTAFRTPTTREAALTLRTFRSIYNPQRGDHLFSIFSRVAAPDDIPLWRGPWHVDGDWNLTGGESR